jgi:hypothetical protein
VSSPSIAFAWFLAAIFAALSALHFYWAFGGRRGAEAAVPEVDGKPLFVPGPAVTLAVAGLLAAAGALVLERAGALPDFVAPDVSRWGTWGLAGVLVLRAVGDFNTVGFFKRRRETRFAKLDARWFSPLALALGLGAALVAWSGPEPEHLAETGPEIWNVDGRDLRLASTYYERAGDELVYVMTYPVPNAKSYTGFDARTAEPLAQPLLKYAYDHHTFDRANIPPRHGVMAPRLNLAVDLLLPRRKRVLFRYEVPAGVVTPRPYAPSP